MIVAPNQETQEDRPDSLVSVEPFPRQWALIQTPATEVLFGGASEGGKSVGIRLATSIWCHLIPGLQVEIYRKFYRDVVNNHMTGELNYPLQMPHQKALL